MVAFHGQQEIKDLYLTRVRTHRAADQLMQGFGYWSKDGGGTFRGCAVGCTLHSDNHAAYELELGIPQLLARLEDGIFEALPVERAMLWPEEFLSAARPGADLSMVWQQFAVWMLLDQEWGVRKFAGSDKSRVAIDQVAALYSRQLAGDLPTASEFAAAAAAAYAAYASAAAYAAYASADAAYAAASSAAAAADAAADAAYAAEAAARKSVRVAQADKLLALMVAA